MADPISQEPGATVLGRLCLWVRWERPYELGSCALRHGASFAAIRSHIHFFVAHRLVRGPKPSPVQLALMSRSEKAFFDLAHFPLNGAATDLGESVSRVWKVSI